MTAPACDWVEVGTVDPVCDKRELRVWYRVVENEGGEVALEFTNHDTNRSTEMRFLPEELVLVFPLLAEALHKAS